MKVSTAGRVEDAIGNPHPELCSCGCPLAPHLMVAVTGNPMDGGLMFCPSCDCWRTWSPRWGGHSVPPMGFTEDEVARIRAEVMP